jgi:hypothetical protein
MFLNLDKYDSMANWKSLFLFCFVKLWFMEALYTKLIQATVITQWGNYLVGQSPKAEAEYNNPQNNIHK